MLSASRPLTSTLQPMANNTPGSRPPLDDYVIYDPVDPFENHAGPFWWRLDDGIHRFAIVAERRHCNSHGIVHGGLMMTMIDLAMVIAAKSAPDEQLVTVSMTSQFLSAGQGGEIIEAFGSLSRRTRSLAFVTGQVHVGERALLQATAVLKPLVRR